MLFTTNIVARKKRKKSEDTGEDAYKNVLKELNVETEEDQEEEQSFVKIQLDIRDISLHIGTEIELDDGETVNGCLIDLEQGKQFVVLEEFETIEKLRAECREQEEKERVEYIEALSNHTFYKNNS